MPQSGKKAPLRPPPEETPSSRSWGKQGRGQQEEDRRWEETYLLVKPRLWCQPQRQKTCTNDRLHRSQLAPVKLAWFLTSPECAHGSVCRFLVGKGWIYVLLEGHLFICVHLEQFVPGYEQAHSHSLPSFDIWWLHSFPTEESESPAQSSQVRLSTFLGHGLSSPTLG